VTGERLPPAEAPGPEDWTLTLDGCVAHPRTWTLEEIHALPQETITHDIHCVTGWTRPACTFAGVRLADLLELVEPTAEAAFARFEAWSARGHDTSLPFAAALDEVWLVHSVEGQPLDAEHGGPLRSLAPQRYFYKSVKWLRRVELVAEDRLGFWEREHGYHNAADPWIEQRYVTGEFDRKKTQQLLQTPRLGPYRGKSILGGQFAGWNPTDRDLRDLALRNCDLAGARLAGVDARASNFTRSDFRNADLNGADLRDADLEGANLAEADLRGADLRGARLTAIRLYDVLDDGTQTCGAHVEGMRYSKDAALLQGERHYLQRYGAIAE